ncbi:MAG: hypothetical protein MJ211_12235 [Bacteroidales bacterium]|nr:hypothetical protein [Bacteroidales bacterium]
MKNLSLYLLLAILLIFSACGAGKKLTIKQQNANQYFYEKNYDSAAITYQSIITEYESKNISAPSEIYASAGKALYYSGKEKEGIDYLYKAESMGFDDELSISMKMKYYAKIDNHTKELDNLEKYNTMYRDGDDIQYVKKRLLFRYMQMKEYQKAISAYEGLKIPDSEEIDNLELYHTALTKCNQKDKANQVAKKIFNLDPNNYIGLNYMAWSCYYSVETDYKKAIAEYEAKKTNATYKIMVDKTKPMIDRYKKAKIYYIKLYNLYKNPTDAAILARIFTRLNDKKNAAIYEKLANKK